MLVVYLLDRKMAEQRIAQRLQCGCAVTMTRRRTMSGARRRKKYETDTANDGTHTYFVITYALHSRGFLKILQARVDEM